MKNKIVYVIHERDHTDGEDLVIGIVDDKKKAMGLIDDYYGYCNRELGFEQLYRDNLEWRIDMEIRDGNNLPYRVTLLLELFEINKL